VKKLGAVDTSFLEPELSSWLPVPWGFHFTILS
jgi:hypothetical protein